MAYTTKENVSEISGLDASAIDDLWLELADREAERITGRSFDGVNEGEEEYFDVDRRNVYLLEDIGSRNFPLCKWPVTAVSTVEVIYRTKNVANIVTENPKTLVEDDDYYVKNEDKGCIISIIGGYSLPEGHKVIRVTYNWGYASAPSDVVDFCSFYAARLVETKSSIPVNASNNPLSEMDMGRYREKYANPNTVYEGKYRKVLKSLEETLVDNYKIWG